MAWHMELIALLSTLFHSFLFALQPFVALWISFVLLWFGLWPVLLLYLVWLFVIDCRTPCRGGRRFEFIRHSLYFRGIAHYFNAKLIKTSDLDPNHNYILGHHPHGVIVFGCLIPYASNALNFDEKFPGINCYCSTLDIMYRVPFVRDYAMAVSGTSVSRDSVEYMCTRIGKGNVIVIVPGGAKEAMLTCPGSTAVVVKQRKGFIRMALTTGSKLVPSYCFGETDLYNIIVPKPGSKLYRFQILFKKVFGMIPLLFYGAFLFLPLRKNLTIIVGAPIDVPKISEPTPEDIDKYHQLYIDGLKDIFDKYKGTYASDPDAQLIIT